MTPDSSICSLHSISCNAQYFVNKEERANLCHFEFCPLDGHIDSLLPPADVRSVVGPVGVLLDDVVVDHHQRDLQIRHVEALNRKLSEVSNKTGQASFRFLSFICMQFEHFQEVSPGI